MWDQLSFDGMFMGDQAVIGQPSEQTITRGRMSFRSRIASLGICRLLVAGSIACTPALVGCSSSGSSDYSAAASAYPSRSLADLFRGSQSSSPPARAISPPPAAPSPQPPAAWSATAGTPLAGVSPPGVAFARAPTPPPAATGTPINTAMVNSPPPAASSGGAATSAAPPAPDEYDAAADAYPSQALFDIFRRDAREAAASSNPPAPSNSAVQAANPAVPGQPAPPSQPAATSPAGAAAAAPSSAGSASPGGYDAAASAYPSVSLHDVIFGPRSSTN
jgi:hypothetical protein